MPADKESIKVTFFDEKFKNLLRDYYSYGFGRLSNENGVKDSGYRPRALEQYISR